MIGKRAHSETSSSEDRAVGAKRQRAESSSATPSDDSNVFPLTLENLQRFNGDIIPAMAPPKSASRSSSPSKATAAHLDSRDKLAAHNIRIDADASLPQELEGHIQSVLRKDRDQPPSPNAKQLVKARRRALRRNELGGSGVIKPLLLFQEEADDGVPFVASHSQVNLAREALPEPPSTHVKKTWGPLSQPQPDSVLGYITLQDALAVDPVVQAPFDAEEELVLAKYRLTEYMHFPFLSTQWKKLVGGESIWCAMNQCAGDGSVIVNHLHHLYKTAYGREPTTIEASHISLTCDMDQIQMFVHWRDTDTTQTVVHHMELINTASLRSVTDMENTRKILHNHLDYALGERLNSIKRALPLFKTRNKASTTQPSLNEASNDTSETPPDVVSVPLNHLRLPFDQLLLPQLKLSFPDDESSIPQATLELMTYLLAYNSTTDVEASDPKKRKLNP